MKNKPTPPRVYELVAFDANQNEHSIHKGARLAKSVDGTVILDALFDHIELHGPKYVYNIQYLRDDIYILVDIGEFIR